MPELDLQQLNNSLNAGEAFLNDNFGKPIVAARTILNGLFTPKLDALNTALAEKATLETNLATATATITTHEATIATLTNEKAALQAQLDLLNPPVAPVVLEPTNPII